MNAADTVANLVVKDVLLDVMLKENGKLKENKDFWRGKCSEERNARLEAENNAANEIDNLVSENEVLDAVSKANNSELCSAQEHNSELQDKLEARESELGEVKEEMNLWEEQYYQEQSACLKVADDATKQIANLVHKNVVLDVVSKENYRELCTVQEQNGELRTEVESLK